MANQEHAKIIKQGIEVWNKWREENLFIVPDLSTPYAVSPGIGKISEPDTDVAKAGLSGMNLSGINLSATNLSGTNLNCANLSGANLFAADLRFADLREAQLVNANLGRANLIGADLYGANFHQVVIGGTIFGEIDLSGVKGLDEVTYWGGPSIIGIDTIIRSHGKISEIFLRNAGIPGPIIEAIPSLIGSLSPIDYYTCFISYSTKNEDFVKRLHADLLIMGIRCWYAPKDMKIGDKIRARIDESIRIYDKLLIVLSEYSIASDWVEKEVETAFEKERRQNKLVLFPIRLDDTVMTTTQAWAADIRRTRHIGDFRQWKNHDDYLKALERLLRDLKAETE